MILLAVGGVALVGLLGVIALIIIVNSIPAEETLEADGLPITNAEAALREAESRVQVLLLMQESREEEIAREGPVTCWFSYPEGGGTSHPGNALRCGPVAFADSEPGTHWLNVPVRYKERDESVWATVGRAESMRTVALEPGEQLERPDDRKPPSPDELELERPTVPTAEPGQVGLVPVDAVMVDLEEPDDGTLAGLGYQWEMLGSGTADRVRLQEEPFGPATVFAAPEGNRWLLFRMTSDLDSLSLPESSVAEAGVDLTLMADDDETSLSDLLDSTDLYRDDETMIAALVPDGSDEVSLVIDDGIIEQEWSFTQQEWSGDAPEILDRDPETLAAQIDQEFMLPYGARDLNPKPAPPPPPGLDIEPLPPLDISQPFGAQDLTVTVGEARLRYGVRLGDPGLGGGRNGEVHKASGLDRALLYLADVEATWSNWMGPGYTLAPEDVVLTLPDGTQVPATRVDGDILSGSEISDSGIGQSVFYGLVWDVPADIETAKVTATFRPANDGGNAFEIYFQEASIEIELDFAASS